MYSPRCLHCLHGIMQIGDTKVRQWKFDRLAREYNEERPHSSLGNATPEEFAAQDEPPKEMPDRDLEAVNNELAYDLNPES